MRLKTFYTRRNLSPPIGFWMHLGPGKHPIPW